jgi:hypothetical protein
MWWWLVKNKETDDTVIYEYGVSTQDVTGKILLSKVDNEVTIIKLAENDSEPSFLKFAGFVRHVIADAGYPDVRSIAIG